MRPLLISSVFLLAALGPAQTLLLRYRPPVGKTASYTVTTAMTMTAPTAPKPMSFTQTTPLTIRVLSQAGGVTTIETRSGPVKTIGGPAMPANPALAKPQVVRVSMDELGVPKGVSGGATPAITSAMGSAMGSGNMGVAFPKRPVKVGDAWNSTFDLGKIVGAAAKGMKATGRIPVVFRLLSLQGGLATIGMTAKGTVAMDLGGRSMTLVMDMRATNVIEAATGLTKSSTTTAEATTTLPGMGAMHQHMTSTMK